LIKCGLANRVGFEAIANMVHHQRHPATAIIFCLSHIRFHRRQGSARLYRIGRLHPKRVVGRNVFGRLTTTAINAADAPGGLVTAALGNLFSRRIVGSKRIGKVLRVKSQILQSRPTAANLVCDLGSAQSRKIRMSNSVARNFITGGRNLLDLTHCQVAAISNATGNDVKRPRHVVTCHLLSCQRLIRQTVIKSQANNRRICGPHVHLRNHECRH